MNGISRFCIPLPILTYLKRKNQDLMEEGWELKGVRDLSVKFFVRALRPLSKVEIFSKHSNVCLMLG